MFLRRLFTILLVTVSFVDITSAGILLLGVRRKKCSTNNGTWYCSKYEKCSTTYDLCIHNPSSLILTQIGLGFGFLLFICSGLYYFIRWLCSYKRKQAKKKNIRRVQTTAAEMQQPRDADILVDPSSASAPLTNEQSPSSYEQT